MNRPHFDIRAPVSPSLLKTIPRAIIASHKKGKANCPDSEFVRPECCNYDPIENRILPRPHVSERGYRRELAQRVTGVVITSGCSQRPEYNES